MRKIISIIGLQLLAFVLAMYQWGIGVRTDEAKYLLDIPYPHPPLARFMISLSDSWQYHELFWRIVFATLVIQSVWLIVDILKNTTMSVRLAVAICWICSAAVLIQAGTVMMSVLTALQSLVFLWLFLRERSSIGQTYIIALFWLGSLFTAYQAILFLPLVWSVLRRSGASWIQRVVLVGLPVGLLALYTFINPLVPASLLTHAGKDAGAALFLDLIGTLHLWMIGGSLVLSIIGTIGLFVRPRLGILCSCALIAGYIFVSRYDYYAILFTPFLIAGVVSVFRRFPVVAVPMIGLMPLGLVVAITSVTFPPVSIIPDVYQIIDSYNGDGDVLIVGSFGHDWQYGTSSTVRRYQSSFLGSARAVICLQPCENMQTQRGWFYVPSTSVEVWVPRRL